MAKHYLAQIKGKGLFIALLLLGIFLLVLGSLGGTEEEKKTEDGYDAERYFASAEVYRNELEARLTVLCESVSGVSDALVLVTLDMGEETVYGGNRQGEIVAHKMPSVRGVAVVCRGGGDIHVRATLITLLSSTLGIGSHRISVSGR